MKVAAVDVGGTTIKVEVLDSSNVAQQRIVVPTPRGDDPAQAVTSRIVQLLRDLDATDLPVGVVVPGLVDQSAGIGLHSATLGWKNAPLADLLRPHITAPVAIGHDVTAGGIAEHELGAGGGAANLAVVVIGTGISSSIWVDHRRLEGTSIGEIGHVALLTPARSTVCVCGRTGCLESIASASAIAQRYHARTDRAVDGAAGVAALLDTDPVARSVWDDAIDALARSLLALVAIVGSERIVITGGLSNAGSRLIDPLRDRVAELAVVESVPDIVPGLFAGRSVIVGAALLARSMT
ncbi:MAG: sugar kinase [Ilumatobacter coccineus]|uniref:Sugar kinase n=1 Tax=Ilumatobacter coccineus TaxID=467094 RepID=A0A2G6KAJ0_9ACTN|nr:MAG: sugar kinase [Ilumatobacter coccineus]